MKYFTFFLLFIIIPAFIFSQERGINIVAVDETTNEWQEISLYDKTHAVIIGIDRYPSLSSSYQLSYAVSDAKAVEHMLKDKYIFNEIYTLYDEQATKSNIEDILLNKLSDISKNDAVFVFFAGHGGQEKTDYGDIGYIVPYDGDFSDMRKVISMTSIKDDISKRINAKHVFFVMDACYSGLLVATRGEELKETKRNISYLKQITKEPVRQVLTAGDANQQVLDGGPNGHSVFTGRFLEILNSAEDYITAEEISSQVKEKVFSDANARGHVQTPKSGILFGLGDFIFMPSLIKKQGDISQQILELETELKKIGELEKLALSHDNETEKRELERQRQIAEAQLAAKKLEEERLEKERIEKQKLEQKRNKELADLKQKQEEEALRLETLKEQVSEKRKQYKSSMILSLDQALEELQSLDTQINEIKASYIEELKKRIMNIAENHSKNYNYSTLVKDEFETQAEFEDRIKQQSEDLKSSNKQEFTYAMETINTAFDEQVAPLLKQVEDISNNFYTIYGHDALKIELGEYNAGSESFDITVASNNMERDIHPQGRILRISGFGWGRSQAKQIGIKEGDIIISYNNILVTPNTNWSELKQSVINNTTTIVVDRGGKKIEFTINKGDLGISTYVDDYAKDLNPNQFIINGQMKVQRSEARTFKQNYLNGFITAELIIKPFSHSVCFVTSAIIVDESNENRYDLFKSNYINLGNLITYDTRNNTAWLTKSNNTRLSSKGSKKYISQFTYAGINLWELPKLEQINNLRNSEIYSYFNFGSDFYQVISNNKYPTYQPSKNSTCCESYGYVIGVINDFFTQTRYFNKSYVLFKERFIKLDNNLIFDSEKKIIWINTPTSDKKMSSLESKLYIKQLKYHELKGWRLPDLEEFQSLQDSSIPGINKIFNFGSNFYQVISNNNYPTYQPSKNSTCCESYGYVIGVM